MTTLRHKACMAAFATVGLLFIGAPTAYAQGSTASTASTETSAPTATAAGKHCVVVVKKLKPGQEFSEVVSQSCSDSAGKAPQAAPAASVKLLTFFQHSNWGGYSVDYFGADGPCDGLGYGFKDLRTINLNVGGISSYTTTNNCNRQKIYNQTNYSDPAGPRYVSGYALDYVGNQYNDHVYSMKVYFQTA